MPSPDLILSLEDLPPMTHISGSALGLLDSTLVLSDTSTDALKLTPTISAILAEREGTYGTFRLNSEVAQSLKEIVKEAPGWEWELTASMKEALHQILSKVSRIVCTDGRHQDSWDDIAGYATLISKELNGA